MGHGAIARALLRCLSEQEAQRRVDVVGILVRRHAGHPAASATGLPATADLDRFLDSRPDLVVECAGHGAVRETCPAVLSRGIDVVLISTGALADPAVERGIRDVLGRSSARLAIPAGAVGGLDLLASARLAGLDRVAYSSRKPPRAWKGTRAEEILDVDTLSEPVEFFRSNAREAALAFPQNANVAATVALAGVGFERTEVSLWADPAATGNEHTIVAEGAFGRATIVVAGNPLPDNPKTSWLAALSLARAVLHRTNRLVV